MSLEIITVIVAIVSVISPVIMGTYFHLSVRRDKAREEREQDKEEKQMLLIDAIRKESKASVDSAVNTGRGMVTGLDQRVTNMEKYNTEKFKSITEEQVRQSKELRVLQSQHVTEHKVDSKLAPITQEIETVRQENRGTREEMRSGFKEIRDSQTLLEMNIQNSGKDISEIKGYLKHWSETLKNDKS